ncbi:MAG: hypothetical protein WC455_13090 [Dehalococcoidia bacterium]|jgi:hypothetical protein
MSIKDEKRPAERVRMSGILPTRMSSGEVREPERRRINTDEVYEELKDMLEMAKLRTLGQTIGGMTYDQRQPQPQHDDGLERLAKVGNMLGIDFTELTKARAQEVDSLRKELDDAKKREIQGRLDLFDKVIADTNNTMKQFMEEQKQERNQPQGFFGMADSMTGNQFSQMLLSKFFGQEEKKQEDPLDAFIRNMETSERVKKILGLDKPEKPVVDPSLLSMGKVEVMKAVLEDERMRAESERNFKLQEMKTEKLGGFLTEFKGLVPDILAAISRRSGGEQPAAEPEYMPAPHRPKRPSPPAAEVKLQSAQNLPPPDQLIYEQVDCPNEGCHKPVPFPVNIPVGMGIECPHCKKTIMRAEEAAPPAIPALPAATNDSGEEDE